MPDNKELTPAEIYGVTFFNRALTKLQVAKRFAGK